jgi:hypothetical protein
MVKKKLEQGTSRLGTLVGGAAVLACVSFPTGAHSSTLMRDNLDYAEHKIANDRGTGSGFAGQTYSFNESRKQKLSGKESFIIELVKTFISVDSSDVARIDPDINEKSFFTALMFLSRMPDELAIPTYDIMPDGDFSYVWHTGKGIVSMAFSPEGWLNYASYDAKTGNRHKGKIRLLNKEEKFLLEKEYSEANEIIFSLIKKVT